MLRMLEKEMLSLGGKALRLSFRLLHRMMFRLLLTQAIAQAVAQAAAQAVAQAVAQAFAQAIAQAIPQAIAQATDQNAFFIFVNFVSLLVVLEAERLFSLVSYTQTKMCALRLFW